MLISLCLITLAFLAVFVFRLIKWMIECNRNDDFRLKKSSAGSKLLFSADLGTKASTKAPPPRRSSSSHRLKMLVLVTLSILISGLILVFGYNSTLETIKSDTVSTQNGDIEPLRQMEPSFLETYVSRICEVINQGDFNEDYVIFSLSFSFTIFILIWNFMKCRAEIRRGCKTVELFPVPVKPFDKTHRFVTAVIYAAYTFSILRIFESLLTDENLVTNLSGRFKSAVNNMSVNMTRDWLKDSKSFLVNETQVRLSEMRESGHSYFERGILVDLLKQILHVLIMGFRYYPVLLCYELKVKSRACFFLCALYTWFLLVFQLLTNIYCRNTFEVFDFDVKRFSVLSSNFSFWGRNINLREKAMDAKTKLEQNYAIYNNSRSVFSDLSQNISTSEISEAVLPKNLFFENLPYYAILCLIALNTTYVLFQHMIQSLVRQLRRLVYNRKRNTVYKESEKRMGYKLGQTKGEVISGNELKRIAKIEEKEESKSWKDDCDLNYTREILKNRVQMNRNYPVSSLRYLFEKYIYKPRKDYRFSKQFINTQIIAFILLYYITSIVIRKSTLIVNLSSNFLAVLINFIFRAATPSSASPETSSFMSNSRSQMNMVVKSLFSHVSTDIIVSCLIATSIYVVQLLLGIRNYHKHILNAYKGVYVDIPSPKRFSSVKMTSSSLHYSGYAIGYMLWGYLILFEITAIVVVLVRFLIAFYVIAENIAKVVLPILTIFLFKRLFIWYLSRYFLTGRSTRGLKNRKLYFILNHFNFFFDCFLGSFVCFVRVLKSGLAALFFMPRLDYSIFGRYLERTDMGFISYVTFIHMEVNQTHPVKLAFCKLLVDSHSLKRGAKNRNMDSNDFDSDDSDSEESYEHSTTLEMRRRSRTMRNKWLVAYTLIKYPYLKKQRKRYLYVQGYVPKVESFDQFVERHTRGMFSNKDAKKKSQSTPFLNALDLSVAKPIKHDMNAYNIRTSTLNPKTDYEPRKKQIASNAKDFSFSTNNTNFSNDSIDIVTGSISHPSNNNNQIKNQNRQINRQN